MADETEATIDQTQGEEKPAVAETTEKPAAAASPVVDQQAEVKRALEAATRIAADAARSGEAYQKTIQALIAPAAKDEPVEEELEIPEEFKPVVKHLEKAYLKDREADKKQREQERLGDLSYRASIEEERAAARHGLDDPRSSVKREEVRDYLAQLPVEYRGNQQIVDESYYAILGRKTAEAQKIESGRASALASSARTSGESTSPRYTPEERAFIQRVNPAVTDEELKVIGRGPVSIEDYKKTRKAV